MSKLNWRNPKEERPDHEGFIVVYIYGNGPAIVHVSEMSYSFWDGFDDTELTDPDEWHSWAYIDSPKP